ncbi:hypothetical protein, partial [Chamaesiphon sp. OTE_75_metabat_556]|uniref:hypothetical protein n=1 Tax=Chamaesiphon sp. OTE_75_metabat_556 TaxID=2964692 RepID=UPI00286C32A0
MIMKAERLKTERLGDSSSASKLAIRHEIRSAFSLALWVFLLTLCFAFFSTYPAYAQNSPAKIFISGDVNGAVDIFNQLGTPIRSFAANYTIDDGFAVGDVDGDGRDEILIAGDVNGAVDIFNQFGTPIRSFAA